jgi:anti-sigma B factor antagonist
MPILFKAPARFDAANVAYFRGEIDRLASATDHVVIDLARTEELDGSGVGAMVFAFKRLQARGLKLSIRSASGQPLNLLNASGLLRTLSAETQTRESRFAVAARRLGLDKWRAAQPSRAPVAVVDAGAAARGSGERVKGAA